MSRVGNIIEGFSTARKDMLNVSLFIASIAAVVVILTYNRGLTTIEITGTSILVASCYLILYLFLLQFRHEVLRIVRKTFFILLAIIVFIFITRLVLDQPTRNIIFLVPFAIIPVIIRTFYDARLALFILLITLMQAGFLVPDPFVFIIMSFISGMVGIFTLTNNFRKSRLFFTSLSVILSYIVLYFGICLMQGGETDTLVASDFLLLAGNGLLVLISYPLILIFEQEFLLVSETTLLELADTNHPLLRKLAVEAPGSFQHSLQVANLAEEAARVIGANLHLVRTGALYHDIGKIGNSKYFIENQVDEISPHDKLDPKESSRIIINHVKHGIVLAKNYKVPAPVIDFIRTHHGTTVQYFFFKKYSTQHPGETGMEKLFSYSGPKPFSKETAVVMMADAVEASSRCLGKYSEESISELVERIIYIQEQDSQFADVPMTYKDMSEIKSAFKRRLMDIYHARIAYPERV